MENQIEILQDKIAKIDDAMEKIMQAVLLLDEVMANDAHYQAYGKCGLEQALGNGNPYDTSVPKLRAELKDALENYEENAEPEIDEDTPYWE